MNEHSGLWPGPWRTREQSNATFQWLPADTSLHEAATLAREMDTHFLAEDTAHVAALLAVSPAQIRGGRDDLLRISLGGGYQIIPSGLWFPDGCDDMTAALKAIMAACGVGTHPTPTGLGMAVLRDTLDGSHSLPNRGALAVLQAHSRNQRVQYWKRPALHQEDVPGAYPGYCRSLPAGTSWRLTRGESRTLATWFCRCTITIPYPLPLAAIPARLDRPRWETRPGDYEMWLWREQVEIARQKGYRITVRDGYGWEYCTDDLAPWVDRMEQARWSLGWKSPAGKGVKAASNATVGSMAAGTTRRTVSVTAPVPVMTRGRYALGWGLVEVAGRPTPLHWQRYAEMRCSLKVFEMALPHVGELAAIETDCVKWA